MPTELEDEKMDLMVPLGLQSRGFTTCSHFHILKSISIAFAGPEDLLPHPVLLAKRTFPGTESSNQEFPADSKRYPPIALRSETYRPSV